MKTEIKRNAQRLSVLSDRYDKIVSLNRKHNYTSSYSVKRKIEQYDRVLLAIKSEQYSLWSRNRVLNKTYWQNLEVAKTNMTKELLFNLTSPVCQQI